MVDVQTIGVLVTAVSVSVAAIYYAFTLRINMKNQELSLKALEQSAKAQELSLKTQQQNLETRQAQLFMGVYQTIATREFVLLLNKTGLIDVKDWNDFDRIMKDQEMNTDFTKIAIFFEGIGVIVKENLVDVRLVSLLISGAVTGWWKKWGPYIVQARAKWGFPRWCIEVEYLSDRIIEYGLEHPELQIVPHV
jgi:hypothetical protein